MKAYQEANAAVIKDRNRKYYIENRRRFSDYYVSNRERAIRTQVEWQKRARRTNPKYIVVRRMSKRLSRVLRGAKPRGWRTLLGYEPGLLVPHIESQFESWMSWQNYGTEWHIDHRRPIASFKLPEEIRECWALENLRPLRALDNIKKGARWQ